jgi:hypothetical protein
MARLFASVRPGERRDTIAAFATLFAFLGGHAVLETARDALFLAKVPVGRLPWMYLAIAALSLLVARSADRLSRWAAGRAAISAWLLVVAGITGLLWAALDSVGSAGVYALYIWSGVLTSLVLVPFWSVLGEAFTVIQAKRLYGSIGAGSVLGAIAGSAAAAALLRVLAPSGLLLVAAGAFGAAASLPLLFQPTATTPAPPATSGARAQLAEDARYIARTPYPRAVALLVLSSACAVTVADFVFKSTLAASVPPAELASWLAVVAVVVNLLSLLAQLGLVGRLLRRFDLAAALSVLPVLLLCGGIGVVAGGGLVAALLVRGADGSLRHSLHRTATELLFVPLPEDARRRTKGFLDVVGQRGGQALASLAILGLGSLTLAGPLLGGVLALVAGLWLLGALALRRHYLDLFRTQLYATESSAFPELDMASLDTLVASLDSNNDDEVLAALGVLEREGRSRLMPALILHHPSEVVVEQALAVLAREGRTAAVRVIDRLLDHPSPRLRAAAISTRAVLAPDARQLNQLLSLEESPEVRAAIVVQLVASGELVGAEAEERIDRLVREGTVQARIGLCWAIALRERTPLAAHLVVLSRAPEVEVRLAAVAAMRRHRDAQYLPALLAAIVSERTRGAAREALVAYGEEGLQFVAAALRDLSLPKELRWQLPRLLQSFPAQRAGPLLLEHLAAERDGMVRYRAIRALEWTISRAPDLTLDRATLARAIDGTVSRAYRYLERRLTLIAGAKSDARRRTPGHDLLVKMLHDKEQNALGRGLRLLALLYPTERFDEIRRGLAGGPKERAGSIELLGSLLQPPLRGAVLGLLDELPDAERLAAGLSHHRPAPTDYEALLDKMLDSESHGLCELTVFHIGELGLVRFRARVEAARGRATDGEIARALRRLGPPPAEAESGADAAAGASAP